MNKKNIINRNPNTYIFPVTPPFNIAYRKENESHPVGPHSHNAAEIYLTLTDLPDVLLNDTVSAVPAGTVIIIPAFCIHQLYHETGITYERYILSINVDWVKSLFCTNNEEYSYLHSSSVPVLLFPNKEQKTELIRRFDELLCLSDMATPEAIILFLQLLNMLHSSLPNTVTSSTSHLPVSSTQQKVNRIIAYLNEHINENITINDIAGNFYLNPDYLARLFKSHMHISLGKYISLLKISAAENMLRDGKSVSEVQEILSFSSYAHFFKTFKKNTGISPSIYRKQYHSS